MRYLFGFLCVCALGVVPLIGCSETAGDGGTGGSAGSGGTAGDGGSGGAAGSGGTAGDGGNGGSAGSGGTAGDGGSGGSGGTGGSLVKCEEFMGCSDAPDGTTCAAEFSGTPGLCMSGECDTTTCVEANCGDGDACTDDVCDPSDGTCTYPTIVCDDFNDCTTDSCNPGEGCEATRVADGTPCDGGTCQASVCDLTSLVLPCTEQGVRNAVAAGGGPYTFDCDEPTTVTTQGDIEVSRSVVLDGEGKLTLDGQGERAVIVFDINAAGGREVEFRGLTVTGGAISNQGRLKLTNVTVSGADRNGIFNDGTMTLTDSTVSGNHNVCGPVPVGGGITNYASPPGSARLTLINTTVSGNVADVGGGIWNDAGTVTLVNSTVSGNTANRGGGLWPEFGTLVLTNSTVSGNNAIEGGAILTFEGTITVTNSVIDGDCAALPPAEQTVEVVSNGYNIESPGDTCGFDPDGTDQVDVTEGELNLGELADNGGPTMTHEPGPGSAAIDAIPGDACEVTEDQRGQPRPAGPEPKMCDVGSIEVQP